MPSAVGALEPCPALLDVPARRFGRRTAVGRPEPGPGRRFGRRAADPVQPGPGPVRPSVRRSPPCRPGHPPPPPRRPRQGHPGTTIPGEGPRRRPPATASCDGSPALGHRGCAGGSYAL
ncbi:hypothetical protein LT493_29765 [Streptomyces tricolor]|nr:hypothetical protein [Streptomyces tricolor]